MNHATRDREERLAELGEEMLAALHDALNDIDASLRGNQPPIPGLTLAKRLRDLVKKAEGET